MEGNAMIRKVASTMSVIATVVSVGALHPGVSHAATPISQANTTIFGPRVYVFDPTMAAADINNVANSVFATQESNQFGTDRFALLFKPGSYGVTFNVGFYTHVAGLGQSPDDVNINGGVNVNSQWMPNANATCNFWRALENFAVTPSSTNGVTRIAVSQAAPLRRLHVKGELHLFDFDSNWKPTLGVPLTVRCERCGRERRDTINDWGDLIARHYWPTKPALSYQKGMRPTRSEFRRMLLAQRLAEAREARKNSA